MRVLTFTYYRKGRVAVGALFYIDDHKTVNL